MTTCTSNCVDPDEDRCLGSTKGNTSDEVESISQPAEVGTNSSADDINDRTFRDNKNYMIFIDDPQYYVYNKFGLVNSLEDRNSHSFQIDEKKANHPVIVDGPELVLNKKLHADSFHEWPNIMLEGCKIMIKEAKNQESIDVDFAIEIRPVNGNSKEWKMLLRRDVIRCYRKYGEKNQKNRKIYMNYAKRVLKEYKQDNSDQLNNPKESQDIPKIYICQKCGFYVCKPPYYIKKMDRCYVAVRSTRERVITVSPHDHHNNEDWMKIIQISQHRRIYSAKKETWETICQLIDDIKRDLKLKDLPIQDICINFGRWTSQAEKGMLPDHCHAHINMTLTKKAIKACEGRTDELGFLQDSIFAPVAYRYLDTIELLKYIVHQSCPIDTSFIHPKTNHFCNLVVPSKLIDCDTYFEQKSENSNDDEDDITVFNTDGYYSQPLSPSCGRYLQIPMRAKSSIIHRLADGKCGKANKIVCNICISS